ncbi:MAG: FliA/WhiG family RNA polymerase sigma factor [Candidatus Riflebacteria bacterium]|nr:FliA/WhiG family RNA polymerase sigma factor [Candidatus Riflebacteria bacterium]
MAALCASLRQLPIHDSSSAESFLAPVPECVTAGRGDDAVSGDALWEEFRRTRRSSARNRLVERYILVVRQEANRLAKRLPSTVQVDDLMGLGTLGLFQAIYRFDPANGVKFSTYARKRIQGAILDELREQDWVPRTVRQKVKQREGSLRELEARLGRTPSREELAGAMGITVEALQAIDHQSRTATVLSLEEEILEVPGARQKDLVADPGSARPEQHAERRELVKLVAFEITKLSPKESLVLTLHYFEELTVSEIARVLHVSDSRVSQLHTAAKNKLRQRLRRHLELGD